MGRCHHRWEVRLNQSVKPHHLPQQMIQKPLWRGKVSFLCTSSDWRRRTHTRSSIISERCLFHWGPWRWSVDRETLGLSFIFYQDHLRIDQVPTSLWQRHENKINSDVLFIYFSSSVYVTLWDVSVSGCRRSPSSIDAKSPLASVKQSDSSGDFVWLLGSRSLRLISILHRNFSYSFIFHSSLLWLFFFHPSISMYLQIWHNI